MEPTALPQLEKLESLRGNPVIVYHWAIAQDGVPPLYECLRKRGRIDRIDLVLSTIGGSVTAARRMALLLREYAQHLTILVPYQARSSGTLLCLSADELVLGPMAELGPIDSQVGAAGSPPPDAPGMISTEDIRAFRRMAEDWFGVTREEDRLQVLALVAQRIFPTSLSSFYRFDKLVRQVADELLSYQLPEADARVRHEIVEKLVGGYFAHDYVLSRGDVRELGLKVHETSPQEEQLLWELAQAYDPQLVGYRRGVDQEMTGLIASSGFRARRVLRRSETPAVWHDGSRTGIAPDEEPWQQGEEGVEDRWEIEA